MKKRLEMKGKKYESCKDKQKIYRQENEKARKDKDGG